MPSLKRLSPSTVAARRCGTPSRRKVAITAAGSVAATMAPTMKPSSRGSPVPRKSAAATTTATTMTPGPASRATLPADRRRAVRSMWMAASKTSPGRSTTRTSSGVTSSCRSGSNSEATSPTATKARVNGIAVLRMTRPTAAATVRKMTNRRMPVSSVSSPTARTRRAASDAVLVPHPSHDRTLRDRRTCGGERASTSPATGSDRDRMSIGRRCRGQPSRPLGRPASTSRSPPTG